ncbi:MAG: hypothetical protein HY821_13490 [Acidobacteria bacterium]|nr:hypothetical protein [Acidobacteriota bacterium]
MTSFIRNQFTKPALAALLLGLAAWAQFPDQPNPREKPEERRLPNGKLQSEAILKADYEANLKDLTSLRTRLNAVEEELKKTQGQVLSLKATKDLEEIEKTARRMRGRMTRY